MTAQKTTPEMQGTTPETTPETQSTTPEIALETPNTRQGSTKEILLELIRQQPDIAASALAARLGIGVDGVKYHLTQLKRTGKIRHVGPTKGGHWEILD
jgi:ATP-dependent DNA helicase RecG